MDSETIVQDLNRRFNEPLPEFYKRRIIIWYDEDKEFEDKLEDIELFNAKLVILTGKNNFEVKKLIAVDDVTSNILIYNPISYENQDDNWLLDVELYSEEFRADLISMWIREMGLPSHPGIRKLVKQYKKFFKSKVRREKIANQSRTPTTPESLRFSIIASIAGVKNISLNSVMRKIMESGLDTDNNKIYQELINYGADEAFWELIARGTGYKEESPDIIRLATHIFITALSRTLSVEFLKGLDGFISSPHQSYCYDFISDWLHSDNSQVLYDIARYIEEEVKLPQRFIKLEIDNLKDSVCFPCINEIILHKFMNEINNQIVNSDYIISIVEKRRICAWYDEVKVYYDGLLQIANMHNFFLSHSSGFHTTNPKKIWEEYTSEYYVMDTYYRLFHKSYAESLKIYKPELQDLFSLVKDYAEGLYKNWFLGQLGNNWSDACADDLREYGYIMEIPKQEDFYKNKVANSNNRIIVIISDALRYEVAFSLAEQLRRETQSQVELTSMQGIFPTITKFGMAALLPHNKLSVEIKNTAKTERLAVLADGMYTDSNYREKVLKSANNASVALNYKDIISMGFQQCSTLVKGMEVVYIYHNKIDSASHSDDSTVFVACDDAIDELKSLVRNVVNRFGSTNIIITSDHGFLYTHSMLNEDDKVSKTTDDSQDIEYGRRYAIMQKNSAPEYLTPIKFLEGNSEYDAYAPRDNIRIKIPGAGLKFVHGGMSLQEMVVPVIEYHFLRNDYKEYKHNKDKYDTKPVTISLLSSSHKISNMIFSLNFYQTEAVSDNREAATYQLYFTDSEGKTISDTQTIIADKTSKNGQERTFRQGFNLKPLKYNKTEVYYLVIADENGIPVAREEFQIDNAFAIDEFDFFG